MLAGTLRRISCPALLDDAGKFSFSLEVEFNSHKWILRRYPELISDVKEDNVGCAAASVKG